MTTWHQNADGFVAYTKGVPETLLPRSTHLWVNGGQHPLQGEKILALA